MKLYNLNTDSIGKYKIIKDISGTYYVDKLTESDRNNLGYYNVEYQSIPDRRYYIPTKTSGLVLNKYVVGYTQIERQLFDVQQRMLKHLRLSYEDKSLRPIVDTGLGYSVYGSQADVAEFIDAKDNAETEIIDTDNNIQSVTGVSYTAISNAIKAHRALLRSTGKTKVSEVKALTTIQECIDYEYEAYDYIVTQEDINSDHNEELVLGETIVKYRNNIIDWNI